ncbi:hypothetical protein CesoFtcFv8_019442 [Champsocephalus esox]|uniref:Uncharacterized protein n=1 Tax=Champsocephalus esox TaxID=159716 RepID=A0AAN8BDR0_9TELE|nr:hypothetical protein CesoFtcFv8_019442 [Champsocephalus esox]
MSESRERSGTHAGEDAGALAAQQRKMRDAAKMRAQPQPADAGDARRKMRETQRQMRGAAARRATQLSGAKTRRTAGAAAGADCGSRAAAERATPRGRCESAAGAHDAARRDRSGRRSRDAGSERTTTRPLSGAAAGPLRAAARNQLLAPQRDDQGARAAPLR